MPAFLQQSPSAPSVAPAAPAAPAAPGAPAAFVVETRSLPSAALTRQDIAALRARRSELSNQLESAAGRRRSLAEQAKRTDGPDKAGLEARMGVLDGRIARLEAELDETGQQLSSPAASRLLASTRAERGPRTTPLDHPAFVPLATIGTVALLAPITLSIARSIWRRGGTPLAAVSGESDRRIERMEQAIDAIAVEMERVSEGQRFVTRLLSERAAPGLNAAQQAAEPLRAREEARPISR